MRVLSLLCILVAALFAKDMPFGKNEELVRTLHNKNDISKNYLEKTKQKYLKNTVSKSPTSPKSGKIV